MKSKTLTVVTVALFCITFLYKAQGQVSITNIEDFAKIKNGTTYVAMKDPNAVKAQPFIDAIKSCWTLSKIEFIKFSEIENHFEPNSSFLTYGDIEKNYYRESWSNSGYSRGVNHQSTHVYFEFWTIVDKFFKGDKKRVRLGPGDKIQLARIELFTDFSTTQVPDKLLKVDFDGMGHINNWSPGILKNYLLLMTDLLNKGKERKYPRFRYCF